MSELNNKDRRKFARYICNFHIKSKKEGKRSWINAFICEISAGGFQFLSKKCYSQNDKIKIEIIDKKIKKVPYSFQGNIKWSKQTKNFNDLYISGVEFKGITEKQQRNLFDLISKHISLGNEKLKNKKKE